MKVSRGKHEPGCRETQQTPFEWTGLKWLHSGTRGCARMVLCDGARGNEWRCAHALNFPNGYRAAGPNSTARRRARSRANRFLPAFGELFLVAHCRALPKAPSKVAYAPFFFYFLSSAHRAPNETRQTPVEAVIRDPTRTSGHHFPGSHSKIHVGKEMWYAIAPLRRTRDHTQGSSEARPS